MQILTIFFIALGLSMDAFAVQLSNGMCYRNFGRRQAVIASFTFGLFQAAMPVIGYFAGYFFSSAISFLDHWIALILLGFIGGSMVWEAVGELRHPEAGCEQKEFTVRVLLVQGVATSIDALAVGITFAFLQVAIVPSVAIIGVVTFVLSFVGVAVGHFFGARFEKPATIVGGAVLILIGVKTLLEHLGVIAL